MTMDQSRHFLIIKLPTQTDLWRERTQIITAFNQLKAQEVMSEKSVSKSEFASSLF